MHSLPVAVHKARMPRMSDDEMVGFEAVLGAADEAVATAVVARNARRVPTHEKTANANLVAVLEAMGALSGTHPPTDLSSACNLIAFVGSAVQKLRQGATRGDPRTRAGPRMDATQMEACLTLVANLNRLLDA